MNGSNLSAVRAVNTSLDGHTNLCGRWLIIARVVWVLVAVLAIGLSAATGPEQYDGLKTVCIEAECDADQLTPGNVQDLEDLVFSVGVFAGLVSGFRTLNLLVWVAIGALIFWRRSDDRVALFTSVTLVAWGGLRRFVR